MMTNSDVSVVDLAVGPSRGCGAAMTLRPITGKASL